MTENATPAVALPRGTTRRGAVALAVARRTAPASVSLATALVATWPLAAHLTTRVPRGTEHEATIPLFSLWNLWWTSDRITHAFHGFVDAPFFFPNTGVTTYSEPMPLLGAVVAPLWATAASPATIYNVALLLVLTLNGVFAYRVARALAVPFVPALVAAAIGVTLPFAADVLGVLPNLALFGMLWTLDGAIRFGRSGSAGAAAWTGAGFAATYFTFEQYALFFAPVAVAAAIVALHEQAFRREVLARLGGAAVVTALLIATLVVPTARIHRDAGGFERPAALVEALSADGTSFVTRPVTALVPIPRRNPADTAGLFPGAALLGLGIAGVVLGLRDGRRRRWTAVLSGMSLFGVLLALGLNLDLGGWHPFSSLRAAVPGFAEVRSPYRAIALAQVALVPLAGIALTGLRARRGTAIVLAVGLLAAAENLSLPAPLVSFPHTTGRAWTAWISQHPERRVLAHVPFPDGVNVADYEIEARRMVAQIDHRRPIVNGYSGFFPVAQGPDGRTYPAYTEFQLAMAHEFPSYQLLCVLSKSLGADTVVADTRWAAVHRTALVSFPSMLRPVYRDPDVEIYALAPRASQCRAA